MTHQLFGHNPARNSVVLMPIDALDVDRHAVDEQLACTDPHVPEPDPVGDGLQDLASFIGERQHRRIEVGCFRSPVGRPLHALPNLDSRLTARRNGYASRRRREKGFRTGVEKFDAQAVTGDGIFPKVAHGRAHVQFAIRIRSIESCPNPEVAYLDGRCGEQVSSYKQLTSARQQEGL